MPHIISPQDWGLRAADPASERVIDALRVSPAELDRRIRGATFEWLPRQFDHQAGAFCGFYWALEKRFEPPQTVNLIVPWQCLAAYDRYQDPSLLDVAVRAAEWFYRFFVESHPMSVVRGGVREKLPNGDLWTKFSAEFILLSLGLFQRISDEVYLERAKQSAGFLIQAARHRFAPKYDPIEEEWHSRGWVPFGRVIEAFLVLTEVTGDTSWRERAQGWGDLALSLQDEDGCFYLIDNEYFNTDLAADELRGLTFLYEQTRKTAYWVAAERFAAWLQSRQRPDGAWPLTIDRDDNIVVSTVGPGDIPNIGIALLRMHYVSGKADYLKSAARAFQYSLSKQILPSSEQSYANDLNARWGFWSWDPYYDYTLSGDQVTHHIRGFMFALDYFSELEATKATSEIPASEGTHT